MESGRNEERGRAVALAIQAAGGSAQSVPVDLRAAGACERLIGTTIERLGGLDVLVNNAGILYTANALDTSDAQWLDTMAVNVHALFI
jgi:NAD(P)-dependent dehydrogenase (short-subunit alcohol dehydrogenase family)